MLPQPTFRLGEAFSGEDGGQLQLLQGRLARGARSSCLCGGCLS